MYHDCAWGASDWDRKGVKMLNREIKWDPVKKEIVSDDRQPLFRENSEKALYCLPCDKALIKR